jgi:hypothetical protein
MGYLMRFSVARLCSAEWMDDRLMVTKKKGKAVPAP